MFAWINFAIMLFASQFLFLLYVRSVSPAGREKIIGSKAYETCFYDRVIAMGMEIIITANFILYFFFPLSTPLPDTFPWPWWVSIVIALVIGIPALLLMLIGLRDAGEEALHPKKEHTLYGGIYKKMRHPQAVGDAFLFPVLALFLHSPFLLIFSLYYFPMFALICYAEEQDLLIRYGDAYAEYCKKTGAFWPIISSSRK